MKTPAERFRESQDAEPPTSYWLWLNLKLDEAEKEIDGLKEAARFGQNCYQDRCENAYVEASLLAKAEADNRELARLLGEGLNILEDLRVGLIHARNSRTRWKAAANEAQQEVKHWKKHASEYHESAKDEIDNLQQQVAKQAATIELYRGHIVHWRIPKEPV